MRWPPWRRRQEPDLTPGPDLDRRITAAEAELKAVRAMKPEVERLGRRMDRHLADNHFSERLVQEWFATWKGRRA